MFSGNKINDSRLIAIQIDELYATIFVGTKIQSMRYNTYKIKYFIGTFFIAL